MKKNYLKQGITGEKPIAENYKMDSGYSEQSQCSTSSNSSFMESPVCSAAYSDFQNLGISDSDSSDNRIDEKLALPLSKAEGGCYLEMIEQPCDKFRFRYKSEMHGTHGSLMGENSKKAKKTFPTVELKGYNGRALIRCTLYQTGHQQGLIPHSHQLVIRRNDKDISDPHDYEVDRNRGYRASFQAMGIIHTAKKFITESLFEKLKKIREYELGRDCTKAEEFRLRKQAEKQSKMNLNQVRLCFQAYKYNNDGSIDKIGSSLFSHPINNMKSALTGELKITRLSSCVSSVNGGDEIILLVEKVGKKNIKVKFFEVDKDDEPVWEAYGIFSEVDVHHQYAITLRTPPYRNPNINEHVKVLIQLERPSDDDHSAPVEFKYKPNEFVPSRKRARTSSSSGYSSSEIPRTVNLDMNDDKSGTTISEEFNKNDLISDLCNEDQLLSENFSGLKKNSDELLKSILIQTFEPFDDNDIDIDDNLEIDGAGTTSQKEPKKFTKVSNIDESKKKVNFKTFPKMVEIIKSFKTTSTPFSNAAKSIKDMFFSEYQKGHTILHDLIQEGDIDEMTLILKLIDKLEIYDVLNLRNRRGDTCLHIACIYNQPAIIKPLINLGIDVNMQNRDGDTALHIAVARNLVMIVTKILEKINYTKLSKKLHVDLANDNGLTPLHVAVVEKQLHLVKTLLEFGGASVKICIAKNGNNVLHLAVEQNNFEVVQYLVNFTSVQINQQNSSGFTPLALAQSNGKKAINIVKLLTTKGAKSELKKVPKGRNADSADSSQTSDEENLLVIDEKKFDLMMDCSNSDIDYLDDLTIKELANILNINKKWKILAKMFNLDHLMILFRSPENMLKSIRTHKIPIQELIDALKQCKEFEAATFLEEKKLSN